MKILIHSDKFYPSTEACANRMKPFVDAFINAGHEVTVITSAGSLSDDVGNSAPVKDILPSVKVLYCDAAPIGEKKSAVRRLINNTSFSRSSKKAAAEIGDIDVVLATTPPLFGASAAGKIARKKNAKLVLDVRDIWPDIAVEMGSFSESSIYFKVFERIANQLYRQADLITTVSNGKEEKIASKLQNLGCRDKKVSIIPNGLDENFSKYPDNRLLIDAYHMDEITTCSYVGNIGLAQGLDSLIDLAARSNNSEYPNVQFLIFGSGADLSHLQAEVAKRKLDNVSFPGRIPKEDVAGVLRHSAFSYIPLKSEKMTDSIPTKLFESLGVGCPVLLVAEGDSCAILDECGLGVHVPPNHPDDMLAAFGTMLCNRNLWKSRQSKSQEIIARKYSRQNSARELEKLIQELF